jgi:hypothetical protein
MSRKNQAKNRLDYRPGAIRFLADIGPRYGRRPEARSKAL